MKNNVANSDLLFIDRPLTKSTDASNSPSLWMLSKSNTDYTDTALRLFLMLCLVASLLLCGLKANGTSGIREASGLGLSVGSFTIHPAVPTVSFGASIR